MKYYYEEKKATRAINFIERYVLHTEGALAGQPFILEEWQKEIVRDIFGMYREDGTRKYRKAYIQVPRGNGKSTLIGALCLVGLFIDGEPAALITYAALNQTQANTVGWKIVSEQIKANPKLSDKVKILNHTHTIDYRPDMDGEFEGLSVFRTVSRDSDSLHGLNCHMSIIDEYHTHPKSDLLDTLATSMLKRRNPLILIITTAGFNMDGPCYKEYLYAKNILLGKLVDESYYVKIYEAPMDADIYAESTWSGCNPNYGVSVFKSYFDEQIQRIKNEPSYENTFRVLHLNQWVNNETTWISDYDWNRVQHDERYEDLKGSDIFLAFDLSSTSDMTALCGMVKKNDVYHSLNWFWLPREQYQGSATYKNESFAQWVESGHITLTSTRTVDYRLMLEKIIELDKDFNVVNIQYDPYNANMLASELERQGFAMQKFRQGFLSMSLPTKEFTRKILSGVFNHMNNPVLRWQAGNVTIMIDEADNYKVIKDKKQPHKKVDGIVSNIMALGGILQHEHEVNEGQTYMEKSGELWQLD